MSEDYSRTFLQFSGGKDSIACLHVLRERWDDLTVVWLNTGAAYPETIDYMQRIAALVPHFRELKSSQNIETEGYPADLLPTSATAIGRQLGRSAGKLRFQSRWTCCAHAKWLPMDAHMRALGATTIIRGTKKYDANLYSNLAVHGAVHDGMRYECPLWEWTDERVFAFIREHDIELPRNYEAMAKGLDCWNCTAYLSEDTGRLAYMRRYYPREFQHVRAVLEELDEAVTHEARHLRRALDEARDSDRRAMNAVISLLSAQTDTAEPMTSGNA